MVTGEWEIEVGLDGQTQGRMGLELYRCITCLSITPTPVTIPHRPFLRVPTPPCTEYWFSLTPNGICLLAAFPVDAPGSWKMWPMWVAVARQTRRQNVNNSCAEYAPALRLLTTARPQLSRSR